MLYSLNEKRDIIMKHYSSPIYKKKQQENAIVKYGESCSDTLFFSFDIIDNHIKNLNFDATGCAYFIASTDILCSKLDNIEIDNAIKLLNDYELLVNGELLDEKTKKELGELNVFDNTKKHFNRLNCALMLQRALKNELNNEKK